MAYRFEGDAERHRPRETAKWALGLALFLSTTAALFALQLFQVSGEGTARPALERAIDALAPFPAGRAKAALAEAVEFTVARAY